MHGTGAQYSPVNVHNKYRDRMSCSQPSARSSPRRQSPPCSPEPGPAGALEPCNWFSRSRLAFSFLRWIEVRTLSVNSNIDSTWRKRPAGVNCRNHRSCSISTPYSRAASIALLGFSITASQSLISNYKFPRFACSISMLSNSALKFPTPKPRAPRRWMTSRNIVGRSWMGREKIWSR